MKLLQVVGSYASGPAERGEAPAWFHHARKSALTHPHVLLQSAGVRYAAPHASRPHGALELAELIELGVTIYLLGDDAAAHGIALHTLPPRVRVLARAELPRLYAEHDQVWLW